MHHRNECSSCQVSNVFSIMGCFMVWGVMFHRGLFHGVGCYSDIGILQHLETIYFCIPVLRDVYWIRLFSLLCGTFQRVLCEFYVKKCLTQTGLLWDFEKPLLPHSLPRRSTPTARRTQTPCHVTIMNSDPVEKQGSAQGVNFLRRRFRNRFSSVFYVIRSFGIVWCSRHSKYA